MTGSALRLFSTRARDAGSAVPWGPTKASQFQPYRLGVLTRRLRLALNVRAAMRATMPNVVPRVVVRTGTEVRPRPGSMAILTPRTAVGGSPAPAKAMPALD